MRRGEKGVSLVEMVIATALGAVAVVGIMDLISSLMRSQSAGRSDVRVQVGALAAARLVEREIAQTNYVIRPPTPGVSSAGLEGCVNAAPPPGQSVPAVIDQNQPVRGYAVCQRSGALYYHSGPACPLLYTCGVDGTLVAGSEGGGAAVTATFERPDSASALIVGDVTVTSQGTTLTTRTSALAAFSPGAAP